MDPASGSLRRNTTVRPPKDWTTDKWVMEYDTIWANNKSDVHRMAKAYGLVTETDARTFYVSHSVVEPHGLGIYSGIGVPPTHLHREINCPRSIKLECAP